VGEVIGFSLEARRAKFRGKACTVCLLVRVSLSWRKMQVHLGSTALATAAFFVLGVVSKLAY
jgi:hypothetical protein